MSAPLAKPPFIWPHFDLGQKQFCANFVGAMLGIDIRRLEHGQRVGPAVFRLIDRDLYRPEWVADQFPAMKAYWQQECNYASREAVRR